jgi:hypothetical protein
LGAITAATTRAAGMDRVHQLHGFDNAHHGVGRDASPTATNGGAPGCGAW